ncbi:MAG: sporulation protein YqfD [bacterium]|nr:sporulation protein YqfD [bacterium]
MNNYYKIEISGKNVSHIFNRILTEKINIFDVSYKKDLITLSVIYEDYLKIKKLNTIYEIKIIEINGLKKYKSLYKFYRLFIILFLISLVFIYIYSKIIFKITIDCQNEELKSIVKEELKKNNFSIFTFQKPFERITEIKNLIKSNNKDQIEWIEIEKNGVFHNVSIIERKKEQLENDIAKHDLVASKNGIIKDMYITSGEILKNKGDYVAKGEVIVSSKIKKGDEVKNIVDAKGKVFAEVWYRVKLSAPLKTKIKVVNGSETLLNLKILGKKITIFKYQNKKITEEHKKILFNNNMFSIHLEKTNTIEEQEKAYSEEELLKIILYQAEKSILDNLDENEKILLQKTLKNTIRDDKMYVEVFFKVYEDIAYEKEFINEEKTD